MKKSTSNVAPIRAVIKPEPHPAEPLLTELEALIDAPPPEEDSSNNLEEVGRSFEHAIGEAQTALLRAIACLHDIGHCEDPKDVEWVRGLTHDAMVETARALGNISRDCAELASVTQNIRFKVREIRKAVTDAG